jgi:hypothetical protein
LRRLATRIEFERLIKFRHVAKVVQEREYLAMVGRFVQADTE